MNAGRVPDAVLWDMDGPLVDTEPYWIRAETELVEEYGGEWTHDLAVQLVGNPLLVSADFIRANSPVTLGREAIVHRLQDRVIEQIVDHLPWRPGAAELLEHCHQSGVTCALVTMSWSALATAVADACPPGSFAEVVTGDQVAQGKPHPEPYLEGLRRLGVEAAGSVALEDSATGARSASAAGIPTIAIPHIAPVPLLEGVVQAPSLRGLTPDDLWQLTATVRAAATAR